MLRAIQGLPVPATARHSGWCSTAVRPVSSAPMPDHPLAYFITLGTYGSRLHGDERGSVDRHHQPLRRDDFRHGFETRLMVTGDYSFEATHRAAVEASFAETATLRSWAIWALNVRQTHLHVVVSANERPEVVMQALKANATRSLREQTGLPRAQKVWARHGSSRYLWHAQDVEAARDYTLNRQGPDLPGSDPSLWRDKVFDG